MLAGSELAADALHGRMVARDHVRVVLPPGLAPEAHEREVDATLDRDERLAIRALLAKLLLAQPGAPQAVEPVAAAHQLAGLKIRECSHQFLLRQLPRKVTNSISHF